MDERAASFAATLGITDAAVRRAFAATPRHLFLPRMSVDEVYRDDALPTRWADNHPTSSSTQPSLMAQMIELLELTPGLRVLEIGAGTGYNAAVIHRITGATVVSVDVQAAVVAEARTALHAAGVRGVRVEHADGYTGAPALGPYDRVVVTCGIRGVPPGWLDQLTGDGFVIAPLAHGGLHPIVRVDLDRRVRVRSGRAAFMHAAGALYPVLPDDFPPPIGDCPPVTVARPTIPLDGGHNDFWFAAAAFDRRVTRSNAPQGWMPALVEGDSVACFAHTEVRAGGPHAAELLTDAVALVECWVAAGRPRATTWHTTLVNAPADRPLLVPAAWEGG